MSIIKFKIHVDGGEGEVEGMKIKFCKLCAWIKAGSDGYMIRQRASGVWLFPGESG